VLGFGERELGLVVGQWRRRAVLDTQDWQAAMNHLAGPDGLTRQAATFARGEVLQALCEALPRGSRVDPHELERACDQFLATRAVALIPDGEARLAGETFRRRDGRVLPAGAERLRYSTPEHLALERQLVDRAVAAAGSGAGVAVAAVVEAVVAARPTLSPDQRRVIETLCLGGDRVAVVAGKAGAGKTFALGAAREAWQEAGYPVLGAAVARRAANELAEGAGIQSTSVTALLNDLHGGGRLPDRCVLVVDEAGMLGTRQLAELLGYVEQSHGKLVLVGDHRQLPEIGAGGSFVGLVRRGLAVELGENIRQVNAWEREALDHLRFGAADSALELYRQNGALAIEPSERATRERLVQEWLVSAPSEDAVMIAQRRADVADLNERARAHLRNAGELGEVELELPGGAFAVGDAVVIKRNDLRLGVANGQRDRVTSVDPAARALTLKLGDAHVRLDRAFLDDVTRGGDPTLLHGYAITGHVAQGATVDRAFVLAGHGISSEWAYVALSRGRLANRLYFSADAHPERAEFAPREKGAREPLERLAAALRTSRAQVLAIDSGSSALADRRLDARNAAERRHALERRKLRWLPRRRRELERARRDESVAIGELRRAQRADAERLHGARSFLNERDRAAGNDTTLDLLADRATERILRGGPVLGREL
jgi:ATP-dependent exoDNAse (exonuclease V) alpha subunit